MNFDADALTFFRSLKGISTIFRSRAKVRFFGFTFKRTLV